MRCELHADHASSGRIAPSDAGSGATRRRSFLRVVVAILAPLALARLPAGRAAGVPLLSPDDPAAKKVKYTEDASKIKEAGGNTCATCSLYQGTYGSKQGGCQLFAGKQVKAAGWCSSWSPQM